MKMFLTRLGSKMVVTRDITERDKRLRAGRDRRPGAGGRHLVRAVGGEDVVRHQLVQSIVAAYGGGRAREPQRGLTRCRWTSRTSRWSCDRRPGAALRAAGVVEGISRSELGSAAGRIRESIASIAGAMRPRTCSRSRSMGPTASLAPASSETWSSAPTPPISPRRRGRRPRAADTTTRKIKGRCSSCRRRPTSSLGPAAGLGNERRGVMTGAGFVGLAGRPKCRQVDAGQCDRRRQGGDRLRSSADDPQGDSRHCARTRPRVGRWCSRTCPVCRRLRDGATERMQRRVERELDDADCALLVVDDDQGIGSWRQVHRQRIARRRGRYPGGMRRVNKCDRLRAPRPP